MKLLIDLEKIEDSSKREELIHSLKLMKISFQTIEKTQNVSEYNKELEKGNTEIEKGSYKTAANLKSEAGKW